MCVAYVYQCLGPEGYSCPIWRCVTLEITLKLHGDSFLTLREIIRVTGVTEPLGSERIKLVSMQSTVHRAQYRI